MERVGTRTARRHARGSVAHTSAARPWAPGLALAALSLTLICGCDQGFGDGPGPTASGSGGDGHFDPGPGGGGPGGGGGDGGGGGGAGTHTGNGGVDDLTPPTLLYAEGEVVGRLLTNAPDAQTFVLRGTLPVPPGIHPRTDGLLSFALRGPGGETTPAQVEVVSRHASPQNGADVVEVLARVQRPGNAAPGTQLLYDVIYSPHEPVGFQPTAHMNALVGTGVFLETRDVFGHLYSADLMRDLRDGTSDLRVLRAGNAAHQVRTHEILVPQAPVAGDQGTLPHHVAAHAYITRWQSDDVVSMDLRIYNGGSGLDPNNPLDNPNRRVYFDELVLWVPAGWNVRSAFTDPFLGQSTLSGGFRRVPLVSPLPGGKLHVMPSQGQMLRRLVLYRDGHEALAKSIVEEETLAFCVDGTSPEGKRLASWWNPQTSRYFTQKQPMPSLAHLNVSQMAIGLENNFNILRDAVATGSSSLWPFPITSPGLGWAHPYGHDIGYAHGGDEITYFPGTNVAYVASTPGYRSFQLTHRMYTSRHATALYNADGEPTALEQWLQPGGPTGQWNPTWVWIKPVLWLGDPFGFNSAPTFQVDAVAAMGKQPDYESALHGFQHIYDSHLVRYLRAPKVLSWLGNDALSKDDLRMQAELVRLTFSDYPNSANGDAIAIGMYLIANRVDQIPGQGAHISRAHGWDIDTVSTAYALATPAWRASVEAWCDRFVDLIEKGQDVCTGAIGINPNHNEFNAQYRTRQSISESILENAIWGMRQTVYGDRRPEQSQRLGNILIAAGYAMISDFFWNPATSSVRFYTALGPNNWTQPPFCTFVPSDGYQGLDNYQGWPTLAYAFRLTGDGIFLTRAVEMAQGNVQTIPSFGGGYLENAAPVMALFQELGL